MHSEGERTYIRRRCFTVRKSCRRHGHAVVSSRGSTTRIKYSVNTKRRTARVMVLMILHSNLMVPMIDEDWYDGTFGPYGG